MSLEQLLAKVKYVISTKGEKGSVLIGSEETVEIDTAPADKVLDPTGAGDAYRSGLLAGLANGMPLAQACKWGAVVSSFAIACFGTQEYSMTRADFETRLAGMNS